MHKELEHIINLLSCNNMRTANHLLFDFIRKHKLVEIRDRMESICREYDLMISFARRGASDPEREHLYERLKTQTTNMVKNAEILLQRSEHAFYTAKVKQIQQADLTASGIRNKLEEYVAMEAMAGIDPSIDISSIAREHHDYVSIAFCHLCFLLIWSEKDRKEFESLILSPTIERHDALLFISAISLACALNFDLEKWLLLTNVYASAKDEEMRQRALVGFATSTKDVESDFSQISEHTMNLLTSEETLNDLLHLQVEIIYSANTDRDQRTINNDIMPGIIKNSNFKVTKHGIEEIEEDELENVLNPGLQDEKLKELEEYYNRLQSMKEQGSDVYYYGFSFLKRYAFFYNIANWFMPYYDENPELVQALGNIEEYKPLLNIVKSFPLCDSDKYSLALGMANLNNQLTEAQKELLQTGGLGKLDVASESPESFRRNYLHSYYRFIRLFPQHKSFKDPFSDVFFCNKFWITLLDDRTVMKLLRILKEKMFHKQLYNVATRYACIPDRSPELLIMLLDYFVETGDSRNATLPYYSLEKFHENSMAIKKCKARYHLATGSYKEACRAYEELLKREPKNLSLRMNYYIARACNGEATAILDEVFQMEYELTENGKKPKAIMNIKRVMAWTLLCAGRIEESLKRYNAISASEDVTTNDILSHGIALWLSGNTEAALQKLQLWIDEYRAQDVLMGDDTAPAIEYPEQSKRLRYSTFIFKELSKDTSIFAQYGKNDTDIKLLIELLDY